MKQIRHIYLIILCALAWSTGAWAADHLPISGKSVNIAAKGRLGGAFNWDDKTSVLQFDGIPNKISFSYSSTSGAATDPDWYIDVSANGTSYTRLWTKDNTNSGSESNIEIKDHSVRYIKFCYSGNFGGNFTNVNITEYPTVYSVDKTSIAFGTKTKGESVAPQGITLTHVNAASSTTVTCSDNANFTVTPTTASTGKDKWGTATFDVTYKNTNVGAHSATITISDGTNAETVSVSGTTQTTYYGQATAVASAGGTAGVSFTSYDAATSSNATTNTTNTTATSGSNTAYYKAVPNTGYAFKGWMKGTSSYSSANVLSESLTYNPSVTYNSETSSSPTVTTYKAWFAPRFFFSASVTSSNESLGTVNVDVAEEILGNVGATSGTVSTTATFTATPKGGDCIFMGWYTSNEFSGNPISTSATYTEDLTNSVVGSTVSATPLYALFKKKQNLTWVNEELDLNLVLGVTGQSSAASVTSGKAITYTSSNENALTIAADGSITTIGLGSSTVTASVAGDEVYREETISRFFNVGERKQATFTPSWGETLEPSLELSETATISLVNVNGDFSVTKGTGDYFSWERTNSNTITITALAAGTTTLTLTQPGDGVYLDGNSVTYTITVTKHPNTFAIAAESKAMKVGEEWTNVVTNIGNDNTEVSYSTKGVATYDAANNKIVAVGEGTTTITFTQAATATHAAVTKDISVIVTKVANTLAISLPTQATEVGSTIALSITGQNNAAAIVGTITDAQLSTSVNNGSDVITYADGVITACNAGTAKITFSQPATAQYTAYTSETYEITVTKRSNAITITRLGDGTAANIKLKYGATATLTYTSTNTETAPVVTRTSGSYTTLSGSTITAGNAAGTDIYEISQAETYKYEAAYAQFTVRVNNTDEGVAYVLYEDKEYSHGTGSGVAHTYQLSGPGETVYYRACRGTAVTIYYNLYVEWSADNQDWTECQNNTSLDPDYKDEFFSCSIPENARYIRFRFPGGGTLVKYIKDVRVTRKTYLRASSDKTTLGETYTDQTKTATFTVNYSSANGGNINISSNNPHFVPSMSSISVPTNKSAIDNSNGNNTTYICGTDGTQTFTVTYTPGPDQLGAEEAVITIGDLFYSQQITLTATAKKYDTTIARGSNTATETTVDGAIDNAFAFSGTSTEVPSSNSADDFYYSISHTQTSDVNKGEGVISYDPATNTITGLNAGTARLTIYQKKTQKYHATSQTFDFMVSKLENNTQMSLSTKTLDVDGTATVGLMNADSDGALSAAYSNVEFTNEAQNREGGLLSFAENTLTAVNAGTATVTITQAETYKYEGKSQTFDVTVNKLPQTLTWDNPDLSTTMQKGNTLEGNTASSDVGLTPVTYSSGNTASITVDASTGVLTAVETGSNVAITASQAGNYKYMPATLTRQFSVFNKQTPIFTPDVHFSGNSGRIEFTGSAIITLAGVSEGNDFTISNSNENIIRVERDGETVTITALSVGTASVTLAQAGNDDFIAKTQTYNIEVYWPDDFLALSPGTAPSYAEGNYRKVFFSRTLKAGYTSIALPFDTDVTTLTGRNNADDWVATLTAVTWNSTDGYTLFFTKGTTIEANKPYILHLAAEVVNPAWANQEVVAAEEVTVSPQQGGAKDGWSMTSNFTVDFPMDGKYGIVNSEGGLMKGSGSNAKLNAFTAYITGPSTGGAVKARTSFLDFGDEGTALEKVQLVDENEVEGYYSVDGRRLERPGRGIVVVKYRDGRRMKVKF